MTALAPLPAAAPVPLAGRGAPLTVLDAKRLKVRLQQLLAAGARVDSEVAVLASTLHNRRGFLLLTDQHGRYFADWTSFCCAPLPWGLGVPLHVCAALAKEATDPARRARLVMDGPLLLRPLGGQRGHAPTRGSGGGPLGRPAAKRRLLNGSDYVLQRLKRDRPDLLAQLAAGTIASVQEAGRLAGLHLDKLRVLASPLAFARAIVCTFDDVEQQELIDLVTHPERIPPPPGRPSARWRQYQQTRATPPR